MSRRTLALLLIIFFIPSYPLFAEIIDVQIKGFDDGIKTTKQQDYKEAVLFAKREAIERAGVSIKSMTTVKDMMVESDYIETQAEAVLMPGYNILDIGYQTDGTYLIILNGNVNNKNTSHEISYGYVVAEYNLVMKAKIDGYQIEEFEEVTEYYYKHKRQFNFLVMQFTPVN
jgi:hypothetical protein